MEIECVGPVVDRDWVLSKQRLNTELVRAHALAGPGHRAHDDLEDRWPPSGSRNPSVDEGVQSAQTASGPRHPKQRKMSRYKGTVN